MVGPWNPPPPPSPAVATVVHEPKAKAEAQLSAFEIYPPPTDKALDHKKQSPETEATPAVPKQEYINHHTANGPETILATPEQTHPTPIKVQVVDDEKQLPSSEATSAIPEQSHLTTATTIEVHVDNGSTPHKVSKRPGVSRQSGTLSLFPQQLLNISITTHSNVTTPKTRA
ncbi:hypothetical protein PG987_002439 [Apiospora arundinis]